MNVSVFGMLPFSQLIKEGFKKLEHKISIENPELIYANDPRGFNEAMLLKKKYPNAYMILNMLDIPWHLSSTIKQQTMFLVDNFLNKADAITTISFKVKEDLSQFVNKNIHVIYNPTQDVHYEKDIKKNNMFLYVGRANDPVKRIKLVHESLLKIKDGINNIKICGSENPGFGNYLGVVSDQELNKLYNSTKYLFLPSKAEGIGLSMIEAMICGSIPITCSDNQTAKEFSPAEFICDPNTQSIVNKINELNKEYEIKRKLALEYGKKYKEQFNKVTIAKNILNLKK
tara:strand:- start:953 stop:1810 length:858 start_codon:yes stop_codon:yes gene_type:complete